MESRSRNRHWRIFAVSAAVLLLTVQIGLAVHGASHLHNVGEIGDCNLCVLNSHFVADTSAPLDLDPVWFVVVLPRKEAEISADTTVQLPIARGPPAASV